VLWTEWNNRLFNNKVKSIEQLMDKAQVLSFGWLKAKYVSFPFGYHMWWQQPFVCLGFG